MDKNIKERVFSVNKIASIFNLSSQTIRYYHKEQLLMPENRGDNNYRNYGRQQLHILSKICYLRKMNFSIQDIKMYLKCTDAQQNIQLLQSQTQKIKNECNNLLKVTEIMQQKVDYLKYELQTLELDKPQVIHVPARKYVPLGGETTATDNELFYLYPTIAHYILTSTPDIFDLQFSAYINFDCPDMKLEEHPYKEIPDSLFLRCYHKGGYHTIVEKIQQLKEDYPHYEFAEEVNVFNIIDQFVENDNQSYIVCIDLQII